MSPRKHAEIAFAKFEEAVRTHGLPECISLTGTSKDPQNSFFCKLLTQNGYFLKIEYIDGLKKWRDERVQKNPWGLGLSLGWEKGKVSLGWATVALPAAEILDEGREEYE